MVDEVHTQNIILAMFCHYYSLVTKASKVEHAASYVVGFGWLQAAVPFGCQHRAGWRIRSQQPLFVNSGRQPKYIRSKCSCKKNAIQEVHWIRKNNAIRNLRWIRKKNAIRNLRWITKPDRGKWPGVGPTNNALRVTRSRYFVLATLNSEYRIEFRVIRSFLGTNAYSSCINS